MTDFKLAHEKQPENECDLSRVTQPGAVVARDTNSFPDSSFVHLRLHGEEPGGFVWLPAVEEEEDRESKNKTKQTKKSESYWKLKIM